GRIDVLEALTGELLVTAQVEVGAIVDALDLAPPFVTDRAAEEELDVEGGLGIVGELVRRMLMEAQPLLVQTHGITHPLHPGGLPALEPLVVAPRLDEELHLHLLELARPEGEVSRR